LNFLGDACLLLGETAKAKVAYRRSLANIEAYTKEVNRRKAAGLPVGESISVTGWTAWALNGLAQAAWREGDLEIDFYLRVLTLGGLVVIPQSYIKVRLNSDSHSAKNAASYAKGYQRSVDELVGSGAFPDLQPLTPRERFRTSFYVTTFRMIQWVGVRV